MKADGIPCTVKGELVGEWHQIFAHVEIGHQPWAHLPEEGRQLAAIL